MILLRKGASLQGATTRNYIDCGLLGSCNLMLDRVLLKLCQYFTAPFQKRSLCDFGRSAFGILGAQLDLAEQLSPQVTYFAEMLALC